MIGRHFFIAHRLGNSLFTGLKHALSYISLEPNRLLSEDERFVTINKKSNMKSIRIMVELKDECLEDYYLYSYFNHVNCQRNY